MRWLRDQTGFTLVEVLVSLVVLLIGVLGLASMSALFARNNDVSVDRTRGDWALYQKVEEFQQMPYTAIATGTDTLRMDGVDYVRRWVVSTNTPIPNVMTITLTARWTQRGDAFTSRITTMKSQT